MSRGLKIRFVRLIALAVFVIAGVLFVRGRALSVSAPTGVAAISSPTNAVSGTPSPDGATSTVPVADVSLSVRGTKAFRVTADRTITAPLRRTLADLGVRVIAPVGARAMLVEAAPAAVKQIVKDARFTVEDVIPTAKIQPQLAMVCENSRGAVPVTVLGLSEADRAALVDFVRAAGGEILQGPADPLAFYASVTSRTINDLAARGDVRWIEYNPPTKIFNDQTVREGASNVDKLRTRHLLRGRGQTVVVCDSGFDIGVTDNCHFDFAGRVAAIYNVGGITKADYHGHGTHVSGTVLGDGARSDGRYKGMAPEANLVMLSCGDTEGSGSIYMQWTYDQVFTKGLAHDSYIHSDSWGSDTLGAYNTKCAKLDEIQWANPEILVVVAAGNDGKHGSCSIGSPAAAKNALTVGNTMSPRQTTEWLLPGDPENLNPTSSRGPTADGRIKPEVAAPGTAVYSTLSSKSLTCDPISGNKYYTEMTGTSMATPLVSGAAALVREWLADRRGMTERPTAALMKAILAGGGVSMSGKGAKPSGSSWTQFNLPQELPNTDYGWGRVNLEETLYPTNGRAIMFADRIPFADQQEWTLDVTTTNAAPLDVQLCWIDHKGDPSASQSLVNDLDLIVSNKTTGAVWCGNGIAGGDHTNTMESVRIAAADAPAGDYAVIVRGYAVAYDSTLGGAAAVYVRGAFEDETAPDPLYIRNVRSNERYAFLDDALKEVQSGDTLEILKPVELAKSVTLAVPCTIVATNADPLASLVTRTAGAAITLASGAELTLTNLVFVSDDDSTAISSSSGSRLILSGTVGVGTVAVEDAEGILFRAPLALAGDRIAVNAPNGFAIGAAFGHWTGEYLSASNTATHVINLLNEELGGVAEKMTGRLVWGVVPCAPEDAKCVVEGDGIAMTYCRTFSQALQVALQQDSTLSVRKPVKMSSPATLSHNLTLVSTNADETVLSLATPTAGFVVPSGTGLVLSNLVVSGADVKLNDCAFKVTGGALTLEDGATLREFSNTYQLEGKPWGGAVVVTAGTFTMKSGSQIADCAAHEGATGGGAIYLGGKAATANLFGGTITGCSAANGGAVYAWGNATTGACVNIKGDFVAKSNTKRNGNVVEPSNVFLCYNAILTIPDHLVPAESRRTVGLAFGTVNGKANKNAEGQVFTALQEGELAGDAEDTARHLFSDLDAELLGEYTPLDDPERYCFKWAKIVVTPPTEPFVGANVWIARDADTKYYYRDLNEALADLSWESPSYVLNVLDDITLTNDVVISKNVVLHRDASLEENPTVWRANNAMYKVVAGGSLAVTNLDLLGASGYDPFEDCYFVDSNVGLLSVNGGFLTLGSGSYIGIVCGDASRAANAITVHGGGTLTMESGSSLEGSQNLYVDESDATGVGGAVLLDNATAYFRGGEINYSAAYRAGGVYVSNNSKAYISGDFVAVDNFDLSFETNDNFVVSKNSELILAGPFTGAVGVNEGLSCDTNCFGTVSKDWAWDVNTLTNSAARFVHDKRDVTGVAVTNETVTLLVWSSALKADESGSGYYYEDGSGTRYWAVGKLPAPPPGPEPEYADPTPIAFRSIVRVSETEWGLVVTDRVQGAEYRLIWTDDLTKGFTTTGAWEQATQDGEWTTNVLFAAPAPAAIFWKAEGQRGIVPKE